MKILFFDTETTGIPLNYKAAYTDTNNWPRLVQLGYILVENGKEIDSGELLVKPDGFTISEQVSKIHGITQEFAESNGMPIKDVLDTFLPIVNLADLLAGHNLSYDLNILGCEYFRSISSNPLVGKSLYDTMQKGTNLVKLPGGAYGKFKWPKLHELYKFLFGKELEQSHTALDDIRKTYECYVEMSKRGVI